MPETKKPDVSRTPQPVLEGHPEWVALSRLAWELAARHVRVSRGRAHMDCAWDPRRNYQWVWDTCFMALYCRYAPDQFPGVESLDNFYELQRSDGYISMTYDMDTGAEPWQDRINPPLFAWVEWEHYCATGDFSRFARAAAHIERLMDWIDANRRNRPHRRLAARDGVMDGVGESANNYQLYYFKDCGSAGMDDSPRTPRLPEAGQFYDWIDLSSQVALSFAMLARLNAVMMRTERSAYWERRARELGELINAELWCERTRFYHDRTIPRNFVASKTAASFWPILAGFCPPDRLDSLCAHLRNEREFNRPTPVPTLSADDPNYSPKGVYWLGGVWAPTNYVIARGLMKAGRGDLAHEIACKYLNALARTHAEVEPHTLWESYSPEENLPGLTPYTQQFVKPDFVGWTGIGPIAMLIENVIGLDINAPSRRATWTIRLIEEHGVQRMPIGGDAFADFLCRARSSPGDPAELHIRSGADLRLDVECAGRRAEVRVPANNPVRAIV